MDKNPFEVHLEGDFTAPDGQHRFTVVRSAASSTVHLGDVLRTVAHEPDAAKLFATNLNEFSIGQELRAARRAQRLTQYDVARASSIPQSMISDIELGKRRDGPSLRVLKTISNALNLDLALVRRNKGLLPDNPAVQTVSTDNRTTEIGRKDSIDDVFTFLRAVIGDQALQKGLELVRDYMERHASSYLDAPGEQVANTYACQFWRMGPYAQARFSALETIIFVPIQGPDCFYAYGPGKSSVEGTSDLYIVGSMGTLCAENKSAKSVSLLSMPATDFLAFARIEYGMSCLK